MKTMPSGNVPKGEWTARTDTPRRSVFGNYRAEAELRSKPTPPKEVFHPADAPVGKPLRPAIDCAMARAFVYRFLAQAYEDPTSQGWEWLGHRETLAALRAAVDVLSASLSGNDAVLGLMEKAFLRLSAALCHDAAAEDSFRCAHLALFGHAARGSCPLNEMEYGELKADPLIQPHRLADLAAFYRAFGLEVANHAGERHDHIGLELEFLCVLAVKQGYALEHQHGVEQLEVCRQAQKSFLRDHLGRWIPAFTRRLAAATNDPALRALAEFTRVFVESDCARFGVHAGSEDLLLRPVDETAESLCASCGMRSLPPGGASMP